MLHPITEAHRDGPPIVEMTDLTCGYDGHAVLSDVNISVMAGDFVGLLGPSGSGKTTLLRAILGAVDVYGGEVTVEGAPTSRKRPKVGYVPQLETIDWNFPVTVREAVMMGRTMENAPFPWFNKREKNLALEMLERLGIADLADRHIRDLSGGQQQRVFLARALVSSPRLLLMDEPTAGVDIKTRDDVMHLLHELNHHGVTIVMTTHEINAVAAHLPWVVCINGRLVAEGPPSQVFTPATFKMTYGAEMPVIQYQGMTLVGERPHFVGADAGRSGVDVERHVPHEHRRGSPEDRDHPHSKDTISLDQRPSGPNA